jgi:CHAD domain-containing protein
MARAELRDARQSLTRSSSSLAERVHGLRTATKKVRALTRLVRPGVGRPARKANRRLRGIAREVSGVRDAEVLLHTLDGLLGSLDGRPSAALRDARARLAARLREARRPFRTERGLDGIAKELARAQRRVGRWLPPGHHDWRAVSPGLLDGYDRARQAMARAYAGKSGADFHAWRRAVKNHRHQVQALREAWPDNRCDELDELDRLGDLLGDEHDLTVLADTIQAELTSIPNQRACARLLAQLETRRRKLRAEARPLGRHLFAEAPRTWLRRLHPHFRTFRKGTA